MCFISNDFVKYAPPILSYKNYEYTKFMYLDDQFSTITEWRAGDVRRHDAAHHQTEAGHVHDKQATILQLDSVWCQRV